MVTVALFATLTYTGSAPALLVGYILGVFAASVFAPAAGALINELFPTSVRASVTGWSVAAGVLGAILGGVAGSAIEGQANKRPGLEITVKLDNGEYRAITQDADEAFRPGERVRLLSSGGVTRVTH
jgi:outer membrane lipoprotein SlyB